MDIYCPNCQHGTGKTYRLETVPGHLYLVVLSLTCSSCGHQWNKQEYDPPVRDTRKY